MRRSNLVLVLAVSLAAAGCLPSSKEPAPPAFSQSDLTGTWDRVGIQTNASPGWFFHTLTVDATGQVTFGACLYPGGACTVTAIVTLHVDGAGNVYATGTGANPTLHGTMTAGKDLIFATASLPGTGTPTGSVLQVFRKRVPGVTWSSADVANLPFAYHFLYTGSGTNWERGGGTTDASGAITVAWSELPSGPGSVPPPGFDTLQVDANGLVTLANTPSFVGVMKADKKAIFGAQTTVPPPSSPEFAFMTILATGASFAQTDLAGDFAFHMVTSGSTAASSPWTYGAVAIDGAGAVTFESATGPSGPFTVAGFTLELAASGAITRPDSASYRGQMSYRKDFYVRTATAANGANSIAMLAR